MNTRSMSFRGRDGLRARPTTHLAHNTEKKWDGTEAVPPMNFRRFLAGKNVHVTPKKGASFLDTRPRLLRTASLT